MMQKDKLQYAWMLYNRKWNNPEDFDFKGFFDLISSFAEKNKWDLSFFDLAGDTYPENIMKPKKALKLLSEKKFKGLNSFGVYIAVPEDKDFAFYWKALVQITIKGKRGLELFIGVNESEITAATAKEALVAPLSEMTKAQYGYAFHKTPDEGIFGYGKGAVFLPEDAELTENEKEALAKWNRHITAIEEGKFRDLYPENLLTKVQLEGKVGKTTLEEWIRSHEEAFTLKDFSPGKKLLTVKKKHFIKMRAELAAYDMLVAYDPEIEPTILSH